MDWLTTDFENLGRVLLAVALTLLAFGWSTIFWYAARTLGKLKDSVDALDKSVTKLFERLNGHSDDLKDIKRRVDRLERRK